MFAPVDPLSKRKYRRAIHKKFTSAGRTGMSQLTTRQSTDLATKRTALRRRLIAFRAVQAIYVPCVPSLAAAHALSVAPAASTPSGQRPAAAASTTSSRIIDRPEDEPLFLPHSLTAEQLQNSAPGLARIEERLREAQLDESLDRLRLHLHVKARLVTFKNRQVRHQGPNTRARRLIDANQEKINAMVRAPMFHLSCLMT